MRIQGWADLRRWHGFLAVHVRYAMKRERKKGKKCEEEEESGE